MRKIILIILILLCTFSCKKKIMPENTLAKEDSLKVKKDAQTKIIAKDTTTSNYWYNENYDGENLIQKGITHPEQFIKNALREKPELIPLKAVLGGTMQFRTIKLLSSEWLIAAFDDGHNQGRGIYRYLLNNKEELEFELLISLGPE
ncbi:hypothetical protein [Flavobacterium cellulosilyticum]|uniref:Uncharacterized protein n=1 Tax=Flavobacterium cellulosilyticum TaxID=2541731 RepID=A0A4R5CG41_9FLAO|nr:hypothetical protein [Flavobacterium cellulosilyticum]TDD97400.1 hypothetical protein E0F76_08815 [Flavobacterium cellulosilyticum]